MWVKNPRSFRKDDQKDVQALFVKTWTAMGDVYDSLLSKGGAGMVFGGTVFTEQIVLKGALAANLNFFNLWMLRTLIMIVCALFSTGLLKMRSWFNLKTYIGDTLAMGIDSIHNHCEDIVLIDGSLVHRKCWVLEDHASQKPSRVVGFIVVKVRVRPLTQGSLYPPLANANIEALVVDMSFQRQGFATALIRTAENYCFSCIVGSGQQRISHLSAIVTSSQHGAVSFYKQMGYTFQSASSPSIFGEKDFRVEKKLLER